MSFKIAKRPVVGFPVSVSVYDANGQTQALEFIAQYKRVLPDELKVLVEGAQNLNRLARGLEPLAPEGGGEPIQWPYKSERDFFADRVCGWIGPQDEGGTPIPFSAQALDQLLTEYPEFQRPLFNGFFDAHAGAREKN
jgi:hypothetical protein